MKVKCEITLELETGDFELKLHNLSEPGKPMDYQKIMEILKKVLVKWDEDPDKSSG